ncbi:MAG: mercury methylation corrinoid protein HgcA [Pseudomonadota bacterium]
MQNLTDNANGCCGKKPDLKTDPKAGLTLSSSNVSLLSSMPDAPAACGSAGRHSHPMAGHEKPGYRICGYVDRFMDTAAGSVPIIKPNLSITDLISTFFVRCGINRYSYTVTPGLYAIGKPDKNSEVLVTANFKLTVDHLRKELTHVNAWILILDTKGINVWCAASEGTFSTDELVRRIKICNLDKIVDHKRLIVPQLGATGVSARLVKKQSGFTVIYGPIRAADIPVFLESNHTADKSMRQVTFTLYERFILTPVEIQIALKPALITALIVFILSGFGPGIFCVSALWYRGVAGLLALAIGIVSGAFVTPVLLPFVPFRQFAPKGILVGSILALLLLFGMASADPPYTQNAAGLTALFLFSVSISSFLAMNFTGTTPFTSPSGVELEMKRFIPVQLSALLISSGLWIYSAF